MMLKIDSEYLDFNDFVEMEKRVKLFESISETLGDFSYSFELPKTSKNLKVLGNPFPDVADKRIYQEINCDLLDNNGLVLYKGILRVERINKAIQCSFFSGNYNWIRLLSGLLTDMDLSDLDTELTNTNIINSWQNTDGIILPLIDTGTLVTRSYKSLLADDFTGCIFLKTLFKRIFQSVGIKINGELLNDPEYNTIIVSRNNKDQAEIDSRSSYASKNLVQAFPDPTAAVILFQDETTYPFFDGGQGNFTSSRYTADVKMRIRLEFSIIYFDDSLVPGGREFGIYINGVFTRLADFETTVAVSNPTFPRLTLTASAIIILEAGDYVEAGAEYDPAGSTASLLIFAGSTFKITPIFIFLISGKALVPQWTKAEFVSGILALFCIISDYDPITKTLTLDFFENIKSKEPIDLSEWIEIYEIDYQEFISNFAQLSLLSYKESDIDESLQYNASEYIKYGAGAIEVSNDFIEKSKTILDSPFKAPVSYLNTSFSASLERVKFTKLQDNGGSEFTSVADNSGNAQFNVPDDTIYSIGELVRVTDSNQYNGERTIKATGAGAGFIVLNGMPFGSSSTGTITKLVHVPDTDDGVYLFINTKYRADNVANYSGDGFYYLGVAPRQDVGYSFFNLLNTGLPINDAYKQGLSFGSVNNILSYQRTLIDKSWGVVGRVLNDPTKIKGIGHVPRLTFNRITPLRPIRIKTEQTNNLYYLNRMSGYKDSYLPCEIDLIKLS